jgi:hypothetical protein
MDDSLLIISNLALLYRIGADVVKVFLSIRAIEKSAED